MLITILTGYFTFKSELDSRFDALEDTDNSQVVELEKKFTELENKFTPIGDGVYTVDPNSTWPPSRGEYKMKDEMSRNKILVLEKEIEELKEEVNNLLYKKGIGGTINNRTIWSIINSIIIPINVIH